MRPYDKKKLPTNPQNKIQMNKELGTRHCKKMKKKLDSLIYNLVKTISSMQK